MNNNSEIQNSFMNNLPADWKYVRLIDYCELIRGTEPGSENYNTEKNGIPFLRVGNIVSGRQNLVYTTQKNTKTCETDDILLTLDGSPGIVTTGWAGAYSSGIRKIVIKDNSLDKNFLYFALQTKQVRDIIEKYTTGVTIKHASKSIPFISFPLPPLPEQRAIAHALDTVRQAIDATDRVIAATRKLKRSMMNHLFTYGPVPIDQVDKVQLKQTEIGEIPQDWNVVQLEKLVIKSITDGPHKTPKYINEGIPFITVKDIKEGKIDFNHCKYISMEEYNNICKRLKPEFGDILLSKVGTIGEVAQVDTFIDFNIFVQLALIKPNKQIISPEYLKYALLSNNVQSEINKNSSQSTMKYIGVNKISNILIPKPSIHVQNQIGNILSIVDTKVLIEEQTKSYMAALFESLLHDLILGKIRINYD